MWTPPEGDSVSLMRRDLADGEANLRAWTPRELVGLLMLVLDDAERVADANELMAGIRKAIIGNDSDAPSLDVY